MNKGRHHRFPGESLRGVHPLCTLHWRGLTELPDVVDWLRGRDRLDTLRLVAEVARHPSLLQLLQGLRAAHLAPAEAAQQLVDDCRRTGTDLRPRLGDVVTIVESVWAYLRSLEDRVR